MITPVDWPKGEQYGTAKFRGLTTDALEADGFEFMINVTRPEHDIVKELKSLTDFVRNSLSLTAEIRIVVAGTYSQEDILKLGRSVLKVPIPTCIRNDISLKTQVSKANTETHQAFIHSLKETVAAPIKISGNIGSIRSTMGIGAFRFAVNLAQAKAIIKEFNNQPKQVIEMLE